MNREEKILKRLKEDFENKIDKRVDAKFLETPYNFMYKDIVKSLYILGNDLDSVFYMLQEIFQTYPQKPYFKVFEIKTEIKIPEDFKLAITNSVLNNDCNKSIHLFYEFILINERDYNTRNRI